MIFNSVVFLLFFLPVFFILYGVTPSKYKNFTLLAGSLFFYAYGNPKNLVFLMGSLVVNFFLGLHLGVGGNNRQKDHNYKKNNKNSRGQRRRRFLLAAAVAGNLGALAFFKIADCLGKGAGLPLGISFYTFQILSYLIDVYRGEVAREYSLVKLGVYVSMFPRIGSGPIICYNEVEGALNRRRFTMDDFQRGLKLFTAGLAAKVLLADRIGILWHDVQTIGFESLSTGMAWLGALAYSMQLYFDFFGYSLMAVGLGRMLGFELPMNFRRPYMARTVREFYRRWHITLGKWFCKYVYVPLGGSRRGELRTVFNLFLVWFLTSLWHGLTPNFLIWGGVLWLCIVLERQMARTHLGERFKVLPHLYLWAVIPVTWMCFAITDLRELGVYLGRMFGVFQGINVRTGDWLDALQKYGLYFGAAFLGCTPGAEKLYRKFKDTRAGELVLVVLFWFCVWRLTMEGNNPFMYLNF